MMREPCAIAGRRAGREISCSSSLLSARSTTTRARRIASRCAAVLLCCCAAVLLCCCAPKHPIVGTERQSAPPRFAATCCVCNACTGSKETGCREGTKSLSASPLCLCTVFLRSPGTPCSAGTSRLGPPAQPWVCRPPATSAPKSFAVPTDTTGSQHLTPVARGLLFLRARITWPPSTSIQDERDLLSPPTLPHKIQTLAASSMRPVIGDGHGMSLPRLRQRAASGRHSASLSKPEMKLDI